MLELTLCSLLTIVPDYLYRRFYRARSGAWRLRSFPYVRASLGITACIMLTVLLITVVFYNHPATTNVVSFFRTIPILPDTAGRVSEIYVNVTDQVKQGQKLFKLDSAKQEAALATAMRRVEQVDAAMEMAKSEIAAAKGEIQQAQGALQQAIDELNTKQETRSAQCRNRCGTRDRQIEGGGRRPQGTGRGCRGALQAAETKISTLLPADKASAKAALDEAQVALDKTIVYAGIDGNLETVCAEGGGLHQSLHAAGRHPYSSNWQPQAPAPRRLRPDRGAGLESRHGGGSYLLLQAACDHSTCRYRSAGLHWRPGSSEPVNNSLDPAQIRQPGTLLAS